MGLFDGLNIANRGLSASQMGIQITGENISNASTEGYSRKRVSLVADSRVDSSYGQMGLGVEILSVERIRDVFIDGQLNDQLSDLGYAETIDYALQRIENIHQEPSDTGLNNALDAFWNAWADVANNPSDRSSREALSSTTEILTDSFHYISEELRSYKTSINEQISSVVDEINNIGSQISLLNKQIMTCENKSTEQANDSRDQRDVLLSDLAKLTDISYFEDETGAVTVTVSGSMFISPQKVYPMEITTQTSRESDGYMFSSFNVKMSGSSDVLDPNGGELQALFEVRDTIIPSYESELDELAATVVSEVNKVHESGYNLYGLTGIDFFNENKTTASTIELSAAVSADSNNIAAASGGIISTPGTVTMNSNNYLVNLTDGTAGGNSQYRNLVTGSVELVNTTTGQTLEEGADKDYVIDYELGLIQIINTGSFGAADTYEVDFQYNDSDFSGVGDGSNALAISGIRDENVTDPDSLGNFTHTIGEFYAGYIGRLGVERNEASAELETRTSLVEQLSTQQQSISGVNLDEEMANLIQFQQTYQASARFMTTISSMLEVLMNI